MRVLISFLLLSLLPVWGATQKHDNVWTLGYGSSEVTNLVGGTNINFNVSPPDTSYVFRSMNFTYNVASVSDAQGNLLFYSDGCFIAGADNQAILNGDSINPGPLHDEYCWFGYLASQGSFFLPHPADSNLYYLIHLGLNNIEPVYGLGEYLYFTLIDRRLDGGRGGVVLKNQVLLEQWLSFGLLAGVRHANGRDWWIVCSGMESNTHYFFLLTPMDITFSHTQDHGQISLDDNGTGRNTFSPDGKWFARYDRYNHLNLFQFDRCTGRFSENYYDEIPISPDSIILTGGVEFSANSRFLYVVTNLWIHQYDLEADDIIASRQRVATWNGLLSPHPTYFFMPQRGPDGKIYISCTNSVNVLHVIHQPDLPGTACQVEQGGLKLPTYNCFSTPYFPNYRLGALPMEDCDSLSINPGIDPELSYQLFPNPFEDYLDLNLEGAHSGNYQVQLTDALGHLIIRESINHLGWDKTYRVPIRNLPQGIYFYSLQYQGKIIGSGKLVRQ
ncbi:MAG: hypothetical protein DHS20C18_51590 [Saprospiraceae bacterium]|nr:MAG: hypothetical protein DHS20C18_51590 [Saprospiraceae bacterium]